MVYEPVTRLEYSVTRGSPIKNHRGVLVFSEAGQGTRISFLLPARFGA